MKKTVILGLFVILQTFAFLGCDKGNSNSALYAQSTNDAQRIIGTWKAYNMVLDLIVTFNSNGTFSWNNSNGRYFINSGKIFLDSHNAWDYYLSSDGKILFLNLPGGNGIWLDKQ